MRTHFICTPSEKMRPDQTSPKGVDNVDAENEQNIPFFIFTFLYMLNVCSNEEANTDPLSIRSTNNRRVLPCNFEVA